MNRKYLVLKFRDAKLFPSTKYSKDKSFDLIKGAVDRKILETFDEPITVHQISNILHVIFGERPVSSVRLSLYDKVDTLFEKAKECFLRIENPKIGDGKGGDKFITEIIQLKKALVNSWVKPQYITWERIRRLIGDELYGEFLIVIDELYAIKPSTHSSEKLVTYFRDLTKGSKQMNFGGKNTLSVPLDLDERMIDFFRLCKIKQFSSLVTTFFDPNSSEMNMAKNRTALTSVMGIDNIAKLRGTILVPVTDEEIKKIYRTNTTILDGGFLYLDSIKNESEINDEGFISVSDISLTKSLK